MYKTTFAELKTRAKDVLKSNYWYSFGVCILVSLITSLGTSVATVTNMVNSDAGSAGTSISAVLQILITLFVAFPLSVGSCRFFIKATVNAPNVYDLFFPYKNNLGNVIGINVFVAIYTFLWSLLFIIPGIIKSFQYSMIPYILAENPAMDRRRAFEVTKSLTDGNKGRIFLFSLSFFGWIILSCITFGIGFLFLEPYISASFTQLYFDLKAEAIAKGTVTPEEFTYNI